MLTSSRRGEGMLHTEIIDSYLAAFSAANPLSVPPTVQYERGWFSVKFGVSVVISVTRYRRREIIEMTKSLRARAG